MIEATCTACGTLNRVAETDIPVGARFVNCSSCKSRVALPTKTTFGQVAGPGARPPAIPPIKPRKPDIELGAPGAREEVPAKDKEAAPGLGLVDLPAPKPRPSPLGPDPSKPAPRSGLAAGLSDLPAPRARVPEPDLAGPDALMPPGAELARSDGGADLPAPKARGVVDLPAPRPRGPDLVDLPAPKAPTVGHGDLPAPKPPTVGLGDLPAPKAPTVGLGDLPAPKAIAPIADLPAPRPSGGLLGDLPAPKRGSGKPPPAQTTRSAAPDDFFELPPSSDVKTGAGELPAPKGFFDEAARPVESKPGNLPAPKGFFDDLPGPRVDKPEVPAPKGFFDDLPGRTNQSKPERPEVPAPKGFFDDLPGRTSPSKDRAEVPAPKGFFDDLPGHTNQSKPDVPAPKGFFDDLPGHTNQARPEAPAPKGFFDDLPGHTNQARSEAPTPKGFFDDLPGRPPTTDANAFFDDLPKPSKPLGAPSPAPPSGDLPLDLGDVPQLELGESAVKPLPVAPPTSAAPDTSFDDLDLSKPTATPPRLDARASTPPPLGGVATIGASKASEVALEIEEHDKPEKKKKKKIEPRRAPAADTPAPSRARKILTAVLLVVVLAGGGFFAYKKFLAKPSRPAQNPAEDVAQAKAAIGSCAANHWDLAGAAAGAALDKDRTNRDAIAIGAEAQLGSALALGVNGPGRISAGRDLIAAAAKQSITGEHVQRAQALSAIAAGNGDGALELLGPMVAANPKDANLLLYTGWAHEARGDHVAAIKTFDQAVTIGTDGCKLHALYGRAQAKLAQNDLAGARADFDAVYQLDKNHVGAQIGIAAAVPASEAQQQEEDLRAILARKDLETADPRAVVYGYVLWGESARRANRYDVARERYRKALVIAPNDLRVLAGLAEIEMQDGKNDAAAELLTQALALSKDDIHAQLVQAELSVRQRDFEDAAARLEALSTRTPPPSAMEMARIKMVYGKFFEAGNDDDKSVAAYEEAAKLAGDADLVPTLAAVRKLTELADKATADKDTRRADDLHERANKLLGALAENAEKDPHVALTLGTAYLQAADPARAEPWLRKVVEARPSDAEGQYQLAKALAKTEKLDEAIAHLQKATSLAPNRADIATELALTYESQGRDDDARALYDKLVTSPSAGSQATEPGVEIRARAGKFYARRGDVAKAAEQGARILEVDPTHPAGLYLKGEGLLAAGKIDDARQLFLKAVEADSDPIYLDAQGRAAEQLARKDNDSRSQDAAIRAYQAATVANPKLFNPHAGLGRLYIARHEAAKAVIPLSAAYEIRHDPEVAYNMGLAYKELQNMKTAANWFRESLKLQPSAEGSYQLGQIFQNLEQGRDAVVQFELAVAGGIREEKRTGKTVPWLTDALYTVGDLQKALNNLGAAREAWTLYVARPDVQAGVKLQSVKRALETSLRGN